MELWIRSQDRKCLIKANLLEYELDANNKAIIKSTTDIDGWYHTIGKYKNKTRALEILDEIQNILNLKDMYKYDRELVLKGWENLDKEQVKIVRQQMSVYEMPSE